MQLCDQQRFKKRDEALRKAARNAAYLRKLESGLAQDPPKFMLVMVL